MDPKQAALNDAVPLKSGCFFPVRKPKPGASVEAWVKWGAMHNLHRAIAEFYHEPATPAE